MLPPDDRPARLGSSGRRLGSAARKPLERRETMSRVAMGWGLRLAVLVALVAVVWLLRATVFAPAPTPVRVAEVRRDRVEQTVTNSRAGTVKTRHRADLSPEIGGRVVALPHRKGDRVEAGEVVLQ